MRDLVQRAEKGDPTTLPVIRKMLEKPENIERLKGNLARISQETFAIVLCDGDLCVREAILAKLKLMSAELLGEGSTPIEHLLVERVVACWLQLHYAELRALQAHRSKTNMSYRECDYHESRIEAAHKRYLAALKALALTRKLALPALHINVARKQINVAGSVVVPGAGG
jgi:hypothetical protein